uniref:TIL domain-containing protein n=1 Tax=Rhabditophanes sp. KR3021 TaxID=114890 RepID=A0AC35TPL5_9BILA
MKVQVIIFASLAVFLMAEQKKIVGLERDKRNSDPRSLAIELKTTLKPRQKRDSDPRFSAVLLKTTLKPRQKRDSDPRFSAVLLKTTLKPRQKRESEPRLLTDVVMHAFKPLTCPTNEVYMECGPGCVSMCGIQYSLCPQSCGKAGCYCTGEFALTQLGGTCIKRNDCPKN